MATAQFGRVITAMITPFTEDGAVDYESAVALAKHLVAHGSEGLLVGGTTGEGATMTAEEKLKLYTLSLIHIYRFFADRVYRLRSFLRRSGHGAWR